MIKAITFSVEKVHNYYEKNNTLFRRQGKYNSSIHRAVWGPGIKSQKEAFRYTDELILNELMAFKQPPYVLDLGCGFGDSLIYLAKNIKLRGEGITISSLQAKYANVRINEENHTKYLKFLEGNFLNLPLDFRDFNLAYSIEAFVHSPDAGKYFSEASRVLGKKGKLIICDDFLASLSFTSKEEQWIRKYCWGWHAGSLITVEQAIELGKASKLKLLKNVDLTPFLELRRPHDRIISNLLILRHLFPFKSEFLRAMIGGDALQQAILSGAINYRFLVFERI